MRWLSQEAVARWGGCHMRRKFQEAVITWGDVTWGECHMRRMSQEANVTWGVCHMARISLVTVVTRAVVTRGEYHNTTYLYVQISDSANVVGLRVVGRHVPDSFVYPVRVQCVVVPLYEVWHFLVDATWGRCYMGGCHMGRM